MYFESREQAGKILAEKLFEKYRYDDCTVVALSEGAVLVGEQIAKALHCVLALLLIEEVDVPGEGVSFGGVCQSGDFTYNKMLSPGELDAYINEYHGYLDEQKQQKLHKINRLLGDGGYIHHDMLLNRVVILVSDGFNTGSSLDIAADFLKPVRTKRIVVAAPVSSVPAVDKMHLMADELCVLDVKDNYFGTEHYYDNNDIPGHEEIIEKINHIILNWQ